MLIEVNSIQQSWKGLQKESNTLNFENELQCDYIDAWYRDIVDRVKSLASHLKTNPFDEIEYAELHDMFASFSEK